MSTPAPSPKWKSRLLTAVGAAALAILVTLSGVTAPIDAWVYDRLVLGAAPDADPRIVVVDIDQKSLAELGRWPWSRRTHAQLVDEHRGGRTGLRRVFGINGAIWIDGNHHARRHCDGAAFAKHQMA